VGTDYRHIGKVTPRRDARDVVTGRVAYLSDLDMAGLLYGRVLRSPHAHARITRVDTARARALPGVRAVLTAEDVPDWRAGTPRVLKVLDSTVRFVGDGVALVAADTEEIAARATDLIEVEYELLPAVYDPEEALQPGAAQLFPEAPGNVVRPGTKFFGPNSLRALSLGDVEQGFDEADAVVEGSCRYDNLPNPLPPESPGVVALWEEPDRATLWLSSQAAYQDKVVLYYAFGRGVQVRTIGGPCGGSYGSKFMTVQLALQAAALSRATARPVKLRMSKEEHLAAFTLRISSRITGRVGMRRDGSLTAISADWLVDTGYYSMTTQAQVAVGLGEVQLALRCRNWDLRPVIACTNRDASGIVRGFGGQELKCSLLPLVSRAMARLEVDPFEFFKRNYAKPGDDFLWRDGERYVYRGIDFSPAMDQGAAAFGWQEKWKGWLRPTSVDGSVRVGVGVAVHGNADIGEDVSEAYVRLDPDGRATVYSAASEHGTGQPSNLCKMVGEVLQLPLERVDLTPPDSAVTPYDFGPVGSRGTYAMGSACIAAAEEARQRLLERAAAALGVDAGRLDTSDGLIYVKGRPEEAIRWNQALGVDHTVMGTGRFEPDYTLANCMMTFVEVAVDTATGKVELRRVVNATDAGCVIDPPGLENQMNGCLGSAGIDSAVFEETVLDPSSGHILNPNLIDYRWRTFAELPPIENVILETPVESHRFHAIGVGEVATAPGPAAVLMAVSNALGLWLEAYPVTPERVLAAVASVRSEPSTRAAGGEEPA
jgi:xanthine dehydrogenase molybdenum-binding subunit